MDCPTEGDAGVAVVPKVQAPLVTVLEAGVDVELVEVAFEEPEEVEGDAAFTAKDKALLAQNGF